LTGTVYAPNGVEPLPGATLYVPNCPVAAFGANVTCDVCGGPQSGCPIVSTNSAADGTFVLNGVPSGSNIPLVIQFGRWRRQISIPTVTACQPLALTDKQTHLPTRSTASIANGACALNPNDSSDQGDIPLMAMATGSVDGLECVLNKIGIDSCEFTSPPKLANGSTNTKPGRVQFYIERGPGPAHYRSNNPGPGANSSTGDAPDWSDPVNGLVTSLATMKNYTMILFACEGGPDLNVVPHDDGGTPLDGISAWQQNLVDYTTAGGRAYTTHYSYTWLTNIQSGTNPPNNGPTPFASTGIWNIDQNNNSPQVGVIDTTYPDAAAFSKGQLFAQWLGLPPVNALCNGTNNCGGNCAAGATPPEICIDTSRHDMDGVNNPPAQQWIHVSDASADYPNVPQHYTFNVPLQPLDGGTVTQCGRVLYSDMHVHDLSTNPTHNFPNECGGAASTSCIATSGGNCPLGSHRSAMCGAGQPCITDTLTASERILEFMLFDLASCITQQAPPPPPPPPTCQTKTCQQLGVTCGWSGDGCGGTQQCPPCTSGTCGGGGVANQCGSPPPATCTKQTCGNLNCGMIGDGCGGSVSCGPPCAPGQTCGANSANVCGVGTCTKTTCALQNAQCGPLADGCGSLLDCGPCPAGQVCIGNKCIASGCTKRTCAQANANCGPVSDGCGGLLDCGPCVPPQTCGGGGTPSQCGGGAPPPNTR
jgi:hypothetical protein